MLCVNRDKFTFYRNQYKWTNVVHTLLSDFSYSAYFDTHLFFEYCELNCWLIVFRDGQGSLTCCSPLGPKEWDTTELLNWNENQYTTVCCLFICWLMLTLDHFQFCLLEINFLMNSYVQVFAWTCAIICLGYRSILQFSGLVTKLCPIIGTPWTIALQAPLSMGFPRQDYLSMLPFHSLTVT